MPELDLTAPKDMLATKHNERIMDMKNIVELDAPKEMRENLEFRDAAIQYGSYSESNAEELRLRCVRDPVFYFDTFVYTYDPREDHGTIPFILRPTQERVLADIITGIENHEDIIIDYMPRDSGSTWITVAVFEYLWHFRDDMSLLFLERKIFSGSESLLYKFNLIHRDLFMPKWLLPRILKKDNRIINLDNRSEIVNDYIHKNPWGGCRHSAILFDAFTTVERSTASLILAATADVSDCRIFSSIPAGCDWWNSECLS